jgi:hypothetical protein
MFPVRVLEQPGGDTWLIGVGVLATVGLVLLGVFRKNLRTVLWPVALLMIAAAVEVGVCGTRRWVSDNVHHPRYIIAALTLLPLAAAVAVISPLVGASKWRLMVANAIALSGVIFAACWRYGWPGEQSPRAILDQRFGRYSQVVRASPCEAVGSEYWTLWTTYFHLRILQHERGGSVPVPVGWRTWEYRRDWHRISERGAFTVVVPKGVNSEVMIECVRRGLEPLTIIERHDSYDIAVTRWATR